MQTGSSIAFLAGEASGDLIAAPVVERLSRSDAHRFVGVGGDHMIAAGLQPWAHIRELSVRGYTEVLRHLPRLLALRRRLRQRLIAEMPRVFVGVDAPDFNLALEVKLRQAGIPTVHFISPSIWAWRPERIELVRRAADRTLLVFPFEQKIYDAAGVSATYVGHPLAGVIPMQPDTQAARVRLGISTRAQVVAVLPGSRPDEIEHIAPVFIETMVALKRAQPDLQFALAAASDHLGKRLAIMLASRHELAACVTLTYGRSYDCMEASDAVLVASGTATLEAALFKKPMVISYRMPRISAWIMRRKGSIAYVGLPNILAGKFLVPELIQERATARELSAAVLAQLGDHANRERLVERFSEIHRSLLRDTPALAADAILATARA